jgi:2-succinyl-6-hydroxy-2,4-cyclohexadiene-1-carboxylate synthase
MADQPDPTGHRSDPVVPANVTGAGDRLVLVHGFTQNRRCWAPADALLARHHEVVCVDAPGHGDAAHLALTLDEAAGIYADAVGPAVWVGYSMGGRLALHVAVARPDAVTALVLVGASPGLADPDERQQRRAADEALASDIETEGVAAFIDRWLAMDLFAGLGPDSDHRAERLANTAAGLASSLRLAGTGAQRSLWDDLGAVTCPVLVVAGGDDTKFTAIAHDMAPRFGGRCDVVAVPGVGHSVHLEAPDRFVAVIEKWLDGVRRQVPGTP